MIENLKEEFERLKKFKEEHEERRKQANRRWYEKHKVEYNKATAEAYRKRTGCTKEYKPRSSLTCN